MKSLENNKCKSNIENITVSYINKYWIMRKINNKKNQKKKIKINSIKIIKSKKRTLRMTKTEQSEIIRGEFTCKKFKNNQKRMVKLKINKEKKKKEKN